MTAPSVIATTEKPAMKFNRSSLVSSVIPTLVFAIGAALLPSHVARANPYATCLTNTAGTISFRLNEAADTVKVIWNGGASVTNLGARARGLTVTNLGTVTSPFQVQVVKAGNNVIGTNAPLTFNSPRS